MRLLVSGSPAGHVRLFANAADSMLRWIDVGIRFVVRMAMRAMGFQSSIGSPQNILSWAHGFQVSWIHARWITAQMVNLQPQRNRADQQFVGKPMGQHLLTWFCTYFQIAIASLPVRTKPQPAASLIAAVNFSEETLNKWRKGTHCDYCYF